MLENLQLADWVAAKAHIGPSGCRIETDAPVETTQAAWTVAKLYTILIAPLAGALKDDIDMALGDCGACYPRKPRPRTQLTRAYGEIRDALRPYQFL